MRNFIKFLYLSILILFFSNQLYSQTDTSFWFVAPEVSTASNFYDRPIYLRLSANVSAANVKIWLPANPSFAIIQKTIALNQTVSIDLTPFIDSIENKPANMVLNRGIKISSDVPISAYYEVAANVNPEIFVLKGKYALGTEFCIIGQEVHDNSLSYIPAAKNAFDIVATENNTLVSITPYQNIIGHGKGITFAKLLNKGQTYSAEATSQAGNGHLIGSKVTSTKPIAITIKDDLVVSYPCADLLGDQLVPVTFVGTDYVVVRGSASDERLYFIPTKDSTIVYLNGNVLPFINLTSSIFAIISCPGPVNYFHATKPIYVYHISGNGCELGGAILPGICGAGSDKVSVVRTTNESFYVSIVTSLNAKNNFLVNGSAGVINGSAFNAVPGNPTLVYAYIDLSSNLIVGNNNQITNSAGLFQLGVIHGGSATGARYGYFSGYSTTSFNFIPDTNMCQGTSITLDAGAGYSSYLWSTGDTTSQIAVNSTGSYWIKVVQNNCILYDTIKVNVFPVPIPDFKVNDSSQCFNNNMFIFSNNSKISSGTITYQWDFGDLTKSIAINPTHHYTNPGVYTVKLKTISNNNCTDSIFRKVYINTQPKADFDINDSLQCLTANNFLFSNKTDTSGGIGYTWSINDNTILKTYDAQHSFISEGTYSVKLVVKSQYNCFDSIIKTLRVFKSPKTNFDIPDSIQCLDVNIFKFYNKSDTNLKGTKLIWDFGDGYTSTITNPIHIYNITGFFDVKLVVDAGTGCKDSIFKKVQIISKSISNFAFDSNDCSGMVNFNNLSTDANKYKWDFGDGSSSTDTNPQHVFNSIGLYSIKLISSKNNGCYDTISKQVEIKSVENKMFIPNAFSPNLDGLNDFFQVLGWDYKCDKYRLLIYSRWGQKIYDSDNYPNKEPFWDGKFDNNYVPSDVYLYIIIGSKYSHSGSVTVLY